eukprot:CAMPEP_0202691710 /NCGR_PEP_ID=MMETSP1385-20130828/6354_1 /ASSEMBLY_ACC=CAM_ASM_000861 /TAXON_ID=933848 /ORGANISM="Elphidium margaritaceum" /LENGTH=340 /DNA_ID=CAMNT_0049347153 /DNA_START=32 /DNA_END=1054 /DNA_ORIENTATION=-
MAVADSFDKIETNDIVKDDRKIRIRSSNKVYGSKKIGLETKLIHRWEFKVRSQRKGSMHIGLVEVSNAHAKRYLFECPPAKDNTDDTKQPEAIVYIMTFDCPELKLTFLRKGQADSDGHTTDVEATSNGFRMCVRITGDCQMVELSSYSEQEKAAKRQGWTTEDEHFLWSNKIKLSMKEIAEKLNRSESACDQKLRKLKNKWKDRWCEQCDKLFDTEKGLKLHNGKTHSSRKKAKKSPPDPEPDSTTLPPKHHKLVWSAKEVAQWLISLGSDYREYAPKFVSAGINGLLLNAMDGTDLQEIVASKLHRSIIMNAWSANRNEQEKKKKSKKKNKYKDSGVE